ncbi:hypothetical protein N7489_003761 [Penicillium chrysogenum]|uniref:Uncharacterized protein n=1 Tax=Penicillium chrysogenum TaxID=5076 RepID=A0ABQ8W9G1_PENCH|nr:uncharacterized protein N7489_003761 [Penicillium chrysogenum]KAJ5243665.1 hypothetical protein N7489_003761 [Penicillium chrysogenum]KAJ5257436.1 hypothetical protein N7524_008992 [Penicillium chrysogenum]KAJ5260812.1 hypothetical protein N7505_009162 [Penicillium chrysogenum]
MGHPPEAHGKPSMPTEGCRSTAKLQDLTTPYECQPISSDNRHRALGSALSRSQVSPRAPRRFLAQPIETVSRSSNVQQSTLSGANQSAPSKPEIHSKEPCEQRSTRRFLPEPIETSKTSNRRSHSTYEVHERNSASQSKTSTAPRRFKPDLIESDTRSVRKGEPVRFVQRHNAVGSSAPHTITSPDTTLWSDTKPNAPTYLPSESQFSFSSLLRRQQARRHSFRVPDLPSIPSNSSEESDNSRSHSACTSPPGPSNKASRDLCTSELPREICDGEISEFLLSLAARSAQIQLKEQALAAFPNEQVYEPVDHFAIDEDDGDSDDYDVSMKYHHIKSRRQSSADLSWELEYMRHHKEEAEMRVRAMGASGQPKSSSEHNKNGKTPPMLGSDIVLPRSDSPEGTICEHSSIDAASRGVDDLCTGCGDLWYAAPPRGGGKGAGLWKGTCCKDDGQEREVHGLLPGIVTPMPRVDEAGISMGLSPSPSYTNLDRFEASPGNHSSRKPASPNLQKAIESEFHDGFVTQIYNYLSLGYPCLARYYDYELSRISGISVEDLRRDDLQTDARGYLVASGKDDLADTCTRWKALRLYIQEWARQEPGMAEEDTNLEGWGLPERRGSWAI